MPMTEKIKEAPSIITGAEQVTGTDYAIEELLQKIGAHVGKKLSHDQLLGWEVKDLTDGRAFLSNILQLRFRWKNNADSENGPNSIIIKVPTMEHLAAIYMNSMDVDPEQGQLFDPKEVDWDVERDKRFIGILTRVQKEVQFYQLFTALSARAPINIPPLKIPKFYFWHDYNPSNRRGLIAMEDLAPVAVSLGLLPGLSEVQMESVIDELAKIHSLSWVFNEECANGIDELPLDANYADMLRGKAMRLIEIKPEWFTELVPQLFPHLAPDKFAELVKFEPEKFGFKASVIHSDAGARNLLWCRAVNDVNEAGSELAAIVDWQTVHMGNSMEDLALILFLSVPASYRRANTQRVLERYLAKVNEFTAGGEYGQPKNIEQVVKAYCHASLYMALCANFGVVMYYAMPSVVGEKNSPNRAANQEELLHRTKCFFEDALDAWDRAA